jgi:hypothetical protein
MSTFTIKGSEIDVESIMGNIRKRVEEKRKGMYTEEEIREIAEMKLDAVLDASEFNSDFVTAFRSRDEQWNYRFDPETIYASSRGGTGGLIRIARRMLNPVLKLFYLASATGALGILLLIFLTAIAIILFFARDRRGENLGSTLVAPLISGIALGAMLVMVVANVAGLLGVEESSPLRWGAPASFIVVLLGGMIYGQILRTQRPHIYAAIGMGAKSTATINQPAPSFSGTATHGGAVTAGMERQR